MQEASLSAWPTLVVRAVVAVFVVALLATSFGADASPALAGDLTGRISTARSGQSYFEGLMRQQDRVMSKIQAKAGKARRKVKRASRTIKRTHKRYVVASKVVRARGALLAEAEARFPDPNEAPDPENWKAKLLRLRRDVDKALDHRQALGRKLRQSNRNRNARIRQLGQLKRERKGVIRRQNYAEAALAAQIVRMTSLAQQRAASQTGVRLAADETFAWPSEGRISQPFGCTGFRLNPRRGSCRHFHDGIDLVAGYGSEVRAAAVGVIAYVGWNPWDEGSRAFIVVVGHPDGYVTRYGHLVPSRKVRVGQLVRKGQKIGKMGSTGNSTGTHLHMELLRNTTPLNPIAYLPDGGAKLKQSKNGKKAHGKQAHKSKKARARKANAKRHQRAQVNRRKAARRDGRVVAEGSGASVACLTRPQIPAAGSVLSEASFPLGPGTGEVTLATADRSSCADAEPSAVGRTALDVLPLPIGRSPTQLVLADELATESVRLPLRGTSPIPE